MPNKRQSHIVPEEKHNEDVPEKIEPSHAQWTNHIHVSFKPLWDHDHVYGLTQQWRKEQIT
jgi:hypothetical protein